MRFKELSEMTDMIPGSIRTYLEDKGYKYIGHGVDQMAFLEPGTRKVLKIFGAGEQRNWNGNFSNPGHEMFAEWAALCQKNSTNPFLPKFSGWETFKWGTYPYDETYLQIRMELLQKLPSDIADSLASAAKSIKYASNFAIYSHVKERLLDVVGSSETSAQEGFNQLAIFLGEEKINKLLDTIYKLARIAEESDWELDLHGDNFMHRNNGVPVIVDPWVT